MTGFYPQINLQDRMQHTKLDSFGAGLPSARMDRVETPSTGDFKSVFSGLVENFNQELNAPDNMIKDIMSGNTNVDIHDVMIAMSKSEINVNVATQAVGKLITAYDKIMQIQV